MVASCHVVLGTETGSSTRPVNAFHQWAVASAPVVLLIIAVFFGLSWNFNVVLISISLMTSKGTPPFHWFYLFISLLLWSVLGDSYFTLFSTPSLNLASYVHSSLLQTLFDLFIFDFHYFPGWNTAVCSLFFVVINLILNFQKNCH